MANLGSGFLGLGIGSAVASWLASAFTSRGTARHRAQPLAASPIDSAAGGRSIQSRSASIAASVPSVPGTPSVPSVLALSPATSALLSARIQEHKQRRIATDLRSSPQPLWLTQLQHAFTDRMRHAAFTLAVRTELKDIQPRKAWGGLADAPSPLAVQRMRDVVDQASAHLAQDRRSHPRFQAADVNALVSGALGPAAAVDRTGRFCALLHALLRSAPVDRELVRYIREALVSEAVASGRPESWLAYTARIVDRRIVALGEPPVLEPSEVDWSEQIRRAPAAVLPKLASKIVRQALAQGWSASRLEDVVSAWVARWQAVGGVDGSARKVTPRAMVGTLAVLLQHVPPEAGATRVAAVVRGWLANVPADLGSYCDEVANRLARPHHDPEPKNMPAPAGGRKEAPGFPDARKLVVLSALGWPVDKKEDPFASYPDCLAVRYGLTALPREDRLRRALDKLMNDHPPNTQLPLHRDNWPSPRVSRAVLATIADACGGRMGEFDQHFSDRVGAFVEAHVAILRHVEAPGGQFFKEFFAREFDMVQRPVPASGGRSPHQLDRKHALVDTTRPRQPARPVQPAPTGAWDLAAVAIHQIEAVQTTHPEVAERLDAFWTIERARMAQTALPPPIGNDTSAELLDKGYVPVETKEGLRYWTRPDEVAALQPPAQRRESKREREASLSDYEQSSPRLCVPQAGGTGRMESHERKDGTRTPRSKPFEILGVPLPPPPSATAAEPPPVQPTLAATPVRARTTRIPNPSRKAEPTPAQPAASQ